MSKQQIIKTIQNNPASSKNFHDNIFIPMTPEQRAALRDVRKSIGRAGLYNVEQRAVMA